MPTVVEVLDLGDNHIVMRPGGFLADMRQGCGPPVDRHGTIRRPIYLIIINTGRTTDNIFIVSSSNRSETLLQFLWRGR
jgi:hypothetical protein